MTTITRDDAQNFLLGLGASSFATLAALKAAYPIGEAMLMGGMVGSGIFTLVYAAPALGRALPAAAHGVVDFRSAFPTVTNEIPAPAPSLVEIDQWATTPPDDANEKEWRKTLRRFLLAGRMAHGMSREVMTSAGFVTSTAYRSIKAVLLENGILKSDKAGTDYARGWSYGRACFYLRCEPLALPTTKPPEVRF